MQVVTCALQSRPSQGALRIRYPLQREAFVPKQQCSPCTLRSAGLLPCLIFRRDCALLRCQAVPAKDVTQIRAGQGACTCRSALMSCTTW